MSTLERMLGRDRLILAFALLLSAAGLLALAQMPRQEDPSFPYRAGIITAVLPGADAQTLAQHVARPIERELAQVEGIEYVRSSSRQDVSVIFVQLLDQVYETNAVWTRVRAALDRARSQLPEGTSMPVLDDRLIGADTAVYAITGGDALARREAAIRLADRLAQVPGVAATRLSGDPGASVAVRLKRAELASLGLSVDDVALAVQARAGQPRAGLLPTGDWLLPLRLDSGLPDLDALRAVQVPLPGGASLPLAALAGVELELATPPGQRAYADGAPAIAVEVKAAREGVDVVRLGSTLRREVADFSTSLAPLAVEELFFQPRYTQERLLELVGSLTAAMGLILLVLLLALGLRAALVVAAILPLVALASVALYALGGGVLQQIFVIGIVVALGILVDNAIVVVEGIERRVDEGLAAREAMAAAVRELAGPLMAATGTTLAAFLPLLLSSGNTADFTRGIPLAVTLSLLASYAFAVLVIPLIAARVLRPSPAAGVNGASARLATLAVRVQQNHRLPALGLGLLLLVGSLGFFPLLQLQFFPEADRAAILVELQLPSGSHPDAVDRVAAEVEDWLREDSRVGRVHRFVGYSGPTFYYNLQRAPRDLARARLLVQTADLAHNRELVERLGQWSAETLPGVELVPLILRQGPPVAAPIEVLVFNEDRAALVAATEALALSLRGIDGIRNLRHSLGQGVIELRVDLPAGHAERIALRADRLQAQLAASGQGHAVAVYRGSEDPLPLRLHLEPGLSANTLPGLPVGQEGDTPLPLAQFARLAPGVQPALVERREQRSMALLSAEVRSGLGPGNVLAEIRRQLPGIELPPGTRIAFAGEAEASGQANTAIIQAAPLGIMAFLFFVLLQFNSLRRAGLVLLSLPFALVGVFPALWLAGLAFGFNALQGVIALVGITVNNAILLVSAVDERLAGGAAIDEAISAALQRRTRPILLTTATTVTGLLPLAWSSSTLWPPMAWAMIGGLIGSALLSLLALPVLVRWVLGSRQQAVDA